MTTEPLILALETASRIGSVALALGGKLLAETTFSAPMRHSAEIFDAIAQLFDRFQRTPQQIDHIYLSVGPGSFTGLRIAVTIAKTMNLANPAKILPVDTLDVIAANVTICPQALPSSRRNDHAAATVNKIAAILDAKRNQFYIAAYKRHKQTKNPPGSTTSEINPWKKILPDSLMTAARFLEEFADPADPVNLIGDGLLHHEDKFKTNGVRILDRQYWSPRASNVHALGWKLARHQKFAHPLTLTPNYIRRPQAEEKSQNASK